MTVIEVILTAFVLADVILNGMTLLLLRDVLRMRAMRGSGRRLWPKVERVL